MLLFCAFQLKNSLNKNWHDRKSERESEHEETAEAERQEDCTDQVGQVKLFTVESVILP